jgi:hypothetical protein
LQRNGNAHSKKIDEFQLQMLESNSQLFTLAKEIRALVLDSDAPQLGRGSRSGVTSSEIGVTNDNTPVASNAPRFPENAARHFHGESSGHEEIRNEKSRIKPGVCHPVALNCSWSPQPQADIRKYRRRDLPELEIPKKSLSPRIETLNAARQMVGAKQLETFIQNHTKERSSPAETGASKSMKLKTQLSLIFRPFRFNESAERGDLAYDVRRHEVSLWVLELKQWLATGASLSKSRIPVWRKKSLDLLVHLNELVYGSNDTLRKIFYEASSSAQIDSVLEQLQSTSDSVRIAKEIEEFASEREDWSDL